MGQKSREARAAGVVGSVQTDDDMYERNGSVKGGWRNDDAGVVCGRHAAEMFYVTDLCLYNGDDGDLLDALEGI